MKTFFRSGEKIAGGRYELIRPIGRGGFSQTFEAYDLSKNPPEMVVIKWLLPTSGNIGYEKLRDDYFHECLILEKVRHQGIIKIVELGREEGFPYLVVEYLRGGTLRDLRSLPDDGFDNYQMNPMTFLDIAIALTEAVEKFHSAGIIHGDIKPSNIGFRNLGDHEPVIFDFGHSRFFSLNEDDTKDRMAASLPYMPPERIGFLEKNITPSSDLYSLGVTLYELATNKTVFHGGTHQEICEKILGNVPESLKDIIMDFPGPLAAIIDKLIRKQPDDRYHGAYGLLTDLQKCRENLKNGDSSHFALGTRDIHRELNYQIPMVGREIDMDRLMKYLIQTKSGCGGFALIGSSSGVGKTRLAREFLTSAAESGFIILRVKFTEFEQNIPLSALERSMAYIQKMMEKISDSDRRTWHDLLRSSLKDRGQLILRKFPYLEQNLPEFPPFARTDPETEESIFIETLVDFFPMIFGPGKQAVLFFDDLQWADDLCLKLIKSFSLRSQETGLGHCLVLAAYRSDEGENVNKNIVPNLESKQYISLGLLDEASSLRLVELLLDESGQEIKKLNTLIYDITQGNPFYIYEFLNASLKNGIFRMIEDGRWIFDENQISKVGLTDSVTDLVTSRIKKISDEAYTVLCTASVIGNNVPVEFLRELLVTRQKRDNIRTAGTKDAFYLNKSLDELKHHHLIWPNDEQLVFFHDRIRSSSYAAMNGEDRKFIHCEYVNILYKAYFEGKDKIDAKILFEMAFHMQNGDMRKDVIRSRNILRLAGWRALNLFAYTRAKGYLKDCSALYPQSFDKITESGLLDEYCEVQVSLSDALALSEEITQAIIIYNFILDFVKSNEKRAEIYLKLSNNHLYMFQYEESVAACKAGLYELGEKYRENEILGLLYCIVGLPVLSLYLLWFKFFGRQVHEIKDNREELLWSLRMGALVPAFFSRPITAVAVHIPYTLRLLSYKDNRHRTMMLVYWGVASACVGLDRISSYCYNRGIDYFKKNWDPLPYAFTLFTMGYLLDFLQGRLKTAQLKIQEALRITTNIGETFIRFLSYQGLIHVDYYGGNTGQADQAIEKLNEFWHKIGFLPNALGSAIRSTVMRNQDDDTRRLIDIVTEAGRMLKSKGFETIDTIYSDLTPGEAYLMLDEPFKALPRLKSALRQCLLHFHRVSYCNYAPVLLSQAYTRSGSPLKGLISLLFSIPNYLCSVRLFASQTRFALGEALYRLGFKTLGRVTMEHAIGIAKRQGYSNVLDELRFYLATYVLEDTPDYAEDLLQRSKKYFEKRGYIFFEEKCNFHLSRVSKKNREMFPELAETNSSISISSVSVVRDILESGTILNMFIRLSVINDFRALLKTAIDTACSLSGADHGVIFIKEDDIWVPMEAKNIDIIGKSIAEFSSSIDLAFLEKAFSGKLTELTVRKKIISTKSDSKSTMILPLKHLSETNGFMYLGSHSITDLFDERSRDLLNPLGTQV
ncbi:MAG: AAA family ATPase, partial [Oligoflexales bacterium]|nr:AAA family ATPase [Oligoflexales bacterium]